MLPDFTRANIMTRFQPPLKHPVRFHSPFHSSVWILQMCQTLMMLFTCVYVHSNYFLLFIPVALGSEFDSTHRAEYDRVTIGFFPSTALPLSFQQTMIAVQPLPWKLPGETWRSGTYIKNVCAGDRIQMKRGKTQGRFPENPSAETAWSCLKEGIRLHCLVVWSSILGLIEDCLDGFIRSRWQRSCDAKYLLNDSKLSFGRLYEENSRMF